MPTPSKRQVLVVDDDPSIRECVATLLMSAGYDVATADNGFGALMQLRKLCPDTIVSDLDMPGMSGFELLSVVRRRFPEILTVAMSGAYVGEQLPSGVVADAFVSKGEHPGKLLRILEGLPHIASIRSNGRREIAPAWIPRNGNDSHGLPYVVVACTECLRTFQVPVVEETTGEVLEIPCHFCPGTSKYIIEPSSQATHQFCA